MGMVVDQVRDQVDHAINVEGDREAAKVANRQRYNLQFETPGLPRLPRLRDSQDSGTPGRLMEKVKATSRKFHSSPNHFQVQIQA